MIILIQIIQFAKLVFILVKDVHLQLNVPHVMV